MRTRLITIDTGALGEGLGYHLRRLARHGRGMLALVRSFPAAKRRTVYFTSPGGLALWYLVLLAVVARVLNYRVVLHHHSYAYLSTRSRAMAMMVAIGGNSAIHIVLCEDMRRSFEAAYRPRGDTVVCSNAAWVAFSSATAVRAPDGCLRIGYLGSLTVEKGLLELAELTLELSEGGVQSELWLAGGPPTRSARSALSAALKALGPRGHQVGILRSPEEKAAFFSSVDVFVLPTRYKHEAQPLVVFEAMSSGTPVIAYSAGCIPGELRGTGLLVSPDERLSAYAIPFLRDLGNGRADLNEARAAVREAFDAGHREAVGEADRLLEMLE